jgi:hypothetical protein
MKKYIFTEGQLKKIIDSQISEQMSPEDREQKRMDASFNAVYGNPPISQQMKKYPKGRFAFSSGMIKMLDQDKTNKLYVVKDGDTISGLVQKLGANSDYNILHDNDLLKGNPKGLQPGMIIAYSLRPSGN